MVSCIDLKNKSRGQTMDCAPCGVSFWCTFPPGASNMDGTRSTSSSEIKGIYYSLYDPFLMENILYHISSQKTSESLLL
jgi:hypothetical protein